MKSLMGLLVLSTSLFGGEMITVRKSEERGKTGADWLESFHTFSFSDYYDQKFMGFRTLRVINEDYVEAAKGFDTHPHKDMEILTFILDGTIEHKDTMGNHSKIQKGEFQLMTAGSGIQHSEFNPSSNEQVHLLQIWIQPDKKGLKPEYQQKNFQGVTNGLKLVVSPNGAEGSLKIHQDARIYLGKLEKGKSAELALEAGRGAWLQVTQGEIDLNGHPLKAGDGASVIDERKITCKASKPAEFLLFDLK